MKKIILTLLFLSVSVFSAEHKVVFSLTTSKVDVLQKQLIDQVELLSNYYAKQEDTFKVAVVIYGEGYRFFLKNPQQSIYADELVLKKSNPELKNTLKNLYKKYNVTFDMCGMGMKKRDIKTNMIHDFVNPVFNKNVALIKWQNKGYAHIKVD